MSTQQHNTIASKAKIYDEKFGDTEYPLKNKSSIYLENSLKTQKNLRPNSCPVISIKLKIELSSTSNFIGPRKTALLFSLRNKRRTGQFQTEKKIRPSWRTATNE